MRTLFAGAFGPCAFKRLLNTLHEKEYYLTKLTCHCYSTLKKSPPLSQPDFRTHNDQVELENGSAARRSPAARGIAIEEEIEEMEYEEVYSDMSVMDEPSLSELFPPFAEPEPSVFEEIPPPTQKAAKYPPSNKTPLNKTNFSRTPLTEEPLKEAPMKRKPLYKAPPPSYEEPEVPLNEALLNEAPLNEAPLNEMPLEEKTTSSSNGEELPPLPIYPMNKDKIRVFANMAMAESYLAKLLAKAAHDKIFVGFDAEWDFNVYTKRAGPVALIQIAHEDDIVLIRVNNSYPANLPEFMASPSIMKVGRAISGDLIKVVKDLALNVEAAGGVELGTLAKSLKAVKDARVGLAVLCAQVLGYSLPKPPAVRCSVWSRFYLSKDQVEYAALDALVSLRVFERLQTLQ